jgi:phage terminase large subunit-like protein
MIGNDMAPRKKASSSRQPAKKTFVQVGQKSTASTARKPRKLSKAAQQKLTAAWTRSEADRRAVANGCYFDLAAAERVRAFFRRFLRHSKGQFAGKPFELLDWQWQDFIAPLFGWKRADGTRRYRRAGVWIPKKNGKSTLASGISLYLEVADDEPGAEVYNCANDRAQAAIVFNEAASMVRKSPALSARLDIAESKKEIRHPLADAIYKALSADVPTKEGLNIHGLIFDELHAQRSRALFDTLRHGTASRRQPLLITISTAGYDRESIGYEQYLYAKGVIEGRIEDDEFFPLIYEAGPDDDWTSEETWKKANPSYGITITAEDFRVKCVEAQQSPANENVFRRYRLNQWTQQDVRWLSTTAWDECGKGSDLQPEDLLGKKCYGGLDLSSTLDITAFVLWFPDFNALLCHFFVPMRACRERERLNKARFDGWADAGFINITSGETVDYDHVRAVVLKAQQEYDLRKVAIDRWNSTQLAQQLIAEDVKVEGFGQGFASMTAPSKHFESLVIAKTLIHFNNPVLRWMAGNVAVETDAAGNLKPTKAKSTEKIDGIVAAIMAIGIALSDDTGDTESVYESRGIIML